jgi:hypothetical protein
LRVVEATEDAPGAGEGQSGCHSVTREGSAAGAQAAGSQQDTIGDLLQEALVRWRDQGDPGRLEQDLVGVLQLVRAGDGSAGTGQDLLATSAEAVRP